LNNIHTQGMIKKMSFCQLHGLSVNPLINLHFLFIYVIYNVCICLSPLQTNKSGCLVSSVQILTIM